MRYPRSVLLFSLMAMLATSPVAHVSAAGPEGLDLVLNMARVVRLNGAVATVIVGNPGIADVTVEDATTLVLTAKSFGSTNLIALDAAGTPLADTVISVVPDRTRFVTVFSGLKRGTLHCAPECEEVVMVGDDAEFTARAKGSADALAALAGLR